MAGVADGAPDGNGAECGGSDQAGGSILAEDGVGLRGPDFASLIANDGVKALSRAGGESGNAAEVPGAGQVGVGSAKLAKG